MPRRAPKGPIPDGYVCKACSKPGHWVLDCPLRVKKTKTDHTRDGDEVEKEDEDSFKIKKPKVMTISKFREPSAGDIARAKEIMPVINPSKAPLCHCGDKASARKCRKEGSDAFGLMFWWCAKKKTDEGRCRFSKKANVIPNLDLGPKLGYRVPGEGLPLRATS